VQELRAASPSPSGSDRLGKVEGAPIASTLTIYRLVHELP